MACVYGALLHFTSMELDQLPPDVQFGIAIDEPYNRRLHPDAGNDVQLRKHSRAGWRSGRESIMVLDRLRWLLKQASSETCATLVLFSNYDPGSAARRASDLPGYRINVARAFRNLW